jgi:hypothetical protein
MGWRGTEKGRRRKEERSTERAFSLLFYFLPSTFYLLLSTFYFSPAPSNHPFSNAEIGDRGT